LEGFEEIKKALDAPQEFESAAAVAPQIIVQSSWLEMSIRLCDMSLADLASLREMFTDSQEFETPLRTVRAKLADSLADSQAKQQAATAMYKEAYALWQSKAYVPAFSKMSALQEIGDPNDESMRLGYGMLAIKTRIESVKTLTKDMAKGRQADILSASEYPAGTTAELLDALAKQTGKTYPPIPQGSRNSSRIGVIDGLVVMSASGAGAVSPKAIQLMPKLEASKRPNTAAARRKAGASELKDERSTELDLLLPSESGNEQIEVHGLRVRLDEYTLASIKDSLRYVSKKKCPDLMEKHRISVMFASTVSINHGGDSAGGAFALAAMSVFHQQAPEADLCVTGAIRPYGDISPVGGIFPKTTAAAQAGFKLLLMPEENCAELQVLDFDQLGGMQVIMGKSLDDYIDIALPKLADRPGRAKKALHTYAAAYLLYRSGELSQAKGLLDDLLPAYPKHFSAQTLLAKLNLAGVTAQPISAELTQVLEKLSLPEPKPFPEPVAKTPN
jgi:hypothetical protein